MFVFSDLGLSYYNSIAVVCRATFHVTIGFHEHFKDVAILKIGLKMMYQVFMNPFKVITNQDYKCQSRMKTLPNIKTEKIAQTTSWVKRHLSDVKTLVLLCSSLVGVLRFANALKMCVDNFFYVCTCYSQKKCDCYCWNQMLFSFCSSVLEKKFRKL